MKEWIVEKAKTPLAYMSKTTEMWGIRLITLGAAGLAAGATWGYSLLIASGAGYGFDRLGDKVVKTDEVSTKMFNEKPSLRTNIGQAFSFNLLPTRRMALAGSR